jgi:hypothetical protein
MPFSQRTLPDGCQLEETRQVRNGRIEKQVVFRRGTTIEFTYKESVALYDREQFTALASAQALSVVDVWPSLQGPSEEAHRQVYWLRRSHAD